MSVNLITGNLFSPIQASQDSDYQAGTFGEKTQILNVGSKMAVSIVDNSTIRCENGVLVTKEGRRVQIDNGDVVEWTIPTGTQGTTSYYIVGFRLYTDDESAQLCDTFVQSMPSESATITEDTFRDGAVEIFVSVARVVQNGVTLESVQSLVPLATTLDQAKEDIIRINSDLSDWIAYNNYFIESDTSHANVTEIDINNANAEVNLPHLVWQKGSGTALIGMPSDISGGWLGVRYVHYFNSQNIVIELLQLGSTTSFNRYYRKYNGTTWGSWYKTSATVVS